VLYALLISTSLTIFGEGYALSLLNCFPFSSWLPGPCMFLISLLLNTLSLRETKFHIHIERVKYYNLNVYRYVTGKKGDIAFNKAVYIKMRARRA
jgi:hypothetical protein